MEILQLLYILEFDFFYSADKKSVYSHQLTFCLVHVLPIIKKMTYNFDRIYKNKDICIFSVASTLVVTVYYFDILTIVCSSNVQGQIYYSLFIQIRHQL